MSKIRLLLSPELHQVSDERSFAKLIQKAVQEPKTSYRFFHRESVSLYFLVMHEELEENKAIQNMDRGEIVLVVDDIKASGTWPLDERRICGEK